MRIGVEAEHRAEVHAGGAKELQAVGFRAGKSLFVRVDAPLAERFQPHPRQETLAHMLPPFHLINLFIDIQCRGAIALENVVGQPIAQEGGAARVAVVRFGVAGQLAVENQADDIERAIIVELVLQGGVDDIVRWRHHIGKGPGLGQIVTIGSEPANVRHG